MLGPFATASRRTPILQVSLLSHARIDVHDNDDANNNNNDNAWQSGPLWPHRMGPITIDGAGRRRFTIKKMRNSAVCIAFVQARAASR